MTEPERQGEKGGVELGGVARSASLLFSLGALAGVLIWAKLRLVTDIPRSAYAVPREIDEADADAGGSRDAAAAPSAGGIDADGDRDAEPGSGVNP